MPLTRPAVVTTVQPVDSRLSASMRTLKSIDTGAALASKGASESAAKNKATRPRNVLAFIDLILSCPDRMTKFDPGARACHPRAWTGAAMIRQKRQKWRANKNGGG